jgi:RNA polymerase sigma-70 factor, ECF subfamily
MEKGLIDAEDVNELADRSSNEKEMEQLVSVIAQRQNFFRFAAMRHLGNVADAEDAVQDAFLSAIRHLNQFTGKAQMSTWLTAIVINSARMKLRQRHRLSQDSLDYGTREDREDAPIERLFDCRPNPEELCQKRERAELILRMSGQLSPVLRMAFRLREIDGVSIREAAGILGVPDGTLKAQVSRARIRLQKMAREGQLTSRRTARAVDTEGISG